MRVTTLALALLSLVGLGAGCVARERRLVPASAAARAPDIPSAAFEDADGVKLTIQGDSWPSEVTPLEQVVTPMLVTIDNQSGKPVLIRHGDFVLKGDSGQTYSALAPDEVQVPNQDRPTTLIQPIFGPAGSAARGNLRPQPPGVQPVPNLSTIETSFPYNQFYFHGYTITPEARRRQPIVRALPEGELPSGAKTKGFVYFGASATSEQRVVLQATLVEPPSDSADGATEEGAGAGTEVARAAIPFRVQ